MPNALMLSMVLLRIIMLSVTTKPSMPNVIVVIVNVLSVLAPITLIWNFNTQLNNNAKCLNAEHGTAKYDYAEHHN